MDNSFPVGLCVKQADAVGAQFLERLEKAAARGCNTTLVYDYVGSMWLQTSDLANLAKAGACMYPYGTIYFWPRRDFRRQFLRNHQKIMLVDGKVGFTGGMNIGGDYCR